MKNVIKTIPAFLMIAIFSFIGISSAFCQAGSEPNIEMVDIPAGYFYMGSKGEKENHDEAPIHKVVISSSFRMSVTEITNKQYEAYDSSHKALRGKSGFSVDDDEPVLQVSWYDAMAFCKWLSEKTGKNYRLPTESEWEYACRANTYSNYYYGAKLSKEDEKNQNKLKSIVVKKLNVGKSKPNSFGLFNMHGNVEEWCLDWYGAYKKDSLINPAGPSSGEYKVVRGGSHNTTSNNLRSANRSAMLPQGKSHLTGFRIVEVDYDLSPAYSPNVVLPTNQIKVNQSKFDWKDNNRKAIFREPLEYIIKPDFNNATNFYTHNHCPTVTWLPNGDIFTAWFSTESESGTELSILASRLRAGHTNWDTASFFFQVPDRNMTGSSFFYDEESATLFHLNGMSAAGWWKYMVVTLRTSKDYGATWSKTEIIAPEYELRHQIIAGMFRTKEGWLVQACDAGPGGSAGTALLISKDNGLTWADPAKNVEFPDFKEGKTGGTIAGIHGGIVQLKDRSFLAFGRSNSIADKNGVDRMPMSISKDGGETWTYKASEFPPIGGGQRLVLMRLKGGAIVLFAYTHDPILDFKGKAGMLLNGKTVYGLYATVSYDEGETWPIKKLITDGKHRFLDGGAWTGNFIMDKNHAEPRGYLTATQSPDRMIHLLSSNIHYQFNLKWLEKQED